MTDREKLLALIQKAKDVCANDYSDHTENEYIADTLLDNGVTFATNTKVGDKWTPTAKRMPDEFVSVLGHMTDAGEFPAVRECYLVGTEFFFPALTEFHPVDKWMEMQKEG